MLLIYIVLLALALLVLGTFFGRSGWGDSTAAASRSEASVEARDMDGQKVLGLRRNWYTDR